MTDSVSGPLIHFSQRPLARVHDVAQRDAPHWKPQGLWFSVGDDEDGWRAWCEREDFRTDYLAARTELLLAPEAKILCLSRPEAIDALTAAFGAESFMGRYGYSIDWAQIAARYDGVIIAPYCWERRIHPNTLWYYAWDCASGCVWNAAAVLELHQLQREQGASAA